MMLEQFMPLIVFGAIANTFIMMFAIGISFTEGPFKYFMDKRVLFIKSSLTIIFLVPIVTLIIISVVKPLQPVAAALAILAACPVIPASFVLVPKAGGGQEYVMNINISVAMLSILTTPIVLFLLEMLLDFNARISPYYVAVQVFVSIILPLFLGVATRFLFPKRSKNVIRPLMFLANLITLPILICVIALSFNYFFALDIRSYAAIILTVAASLLLGHIISSKIPEEKTTLALECAMRNIGLALLIASVNYPDKNALPIIVAYLFILWVVSAIYIRWRKHSTRVTASG